MPRPPPSSSFGRHRFTFSGGGGGSDQYVFDRGGGEGRAGGGGGGGRRTNIGWREEARGGGEAAGPGVDYRGSCGNISQTAGGRGLTTAEPQNKHLHGSGSMVWKSGRCTGTLSSAPWPKKTPQKTKWKINRNFAVCIDSQVSWVTLKKLCKF